MQKLTNRQTKHTNNLAAPPQAIYLNMKQIKYHFECTQLNQTKSYK